MAYTDPYSSNEPAQQLGFGDVVGALNPISLTTTAYTSIPSVWSTTKGIWTPINLNQKVWKTQLRNVFTKDKFDIKNKLIGKKFAVNWKKIPEAIKNTFSLNPWGGFRIGQDYLQTDFTKKAAGRLKSSEEFMAKSKLLGEEWERLNLPGQLYKGKHKMPKEVREKARSEFMSTRVRALREKDKVAPLLKMAKTQKLAKWAITGAKAGSIIGAVTLAWDISSAVASPLLNSSVQLLGNAINTFENRFMPEMGGRLQQSYLSYGAATERQRAISAMSKAYINGRSAFGSEGQLYHQ
jgi:hypothetical protein